MANEIVIGVPRIELTDGHCRLVADVRIPSRRARGQDSWALFLEVPCEYGDYLTADRCDAFLVGLLHYALYHGFDMKCEAPVTAELHYQLSNMLIPALTDHGKRRIRLKADLIDGKFENVGAVGSGISCGVDSMHVLINHLNNPIKSMRLTHLTINNVGAFRSDSSQYQRSRQTARQVAASLNLPLIDCNSNINAFVDYPFEYSHTFLNAFPVLALGRLWQTFFYGSSGYDYSHFCVGSKSLSLACDVYDCLSLNCFSYSGPNLISDGGALTRFEKTAAIQDFALAQKYLNVCVMDDGYNCGRCEKCRRTLLNLDALGALTKFSSVFNLDAYYRCKWKYLGWALYRRWIGRGDMTNDALSVLRGQLGVTGEAFAIARLMARPFKGI